MIQEHPATGRLPEGFPGQRMRVLPRPVVARALRSPVTAQLLVTDAGFFPHASRHGRARPLGAEQNIVIVCASGLGRCALPSGNHRVPPGHALVIPAGTPHSYEAAEREPWTLWWIHVVGTGVPDLFAAIGVSTAHPVLRIVDPPRIITLFDTIIHCMERDETTASLLAASGAAWHALTLIAAGRHTACRASGDPVAATIEYLRANASTRISVAELASMANLSESHYSARFRRATGFAVLEYQTRQRMSLARELLDTTNLKIASIAQQVGYADALYFSRQFRRIHEMSPRDYRAHDHG